MCVPYAEGGLNFRSFDDLYAASMLKAWHRLRQGSSLWSKFMLTKYCRLKHPSTSSINEHHSKIWRGFAVFRHQAEENLTWHLGTGDKDFWIDPWLSSGPINQHAKSGTKVKEFWANNNWNLSKLQPLVESDNQFNSDMLQEMLQITLYPDREDILLWKPSSNSSFSFKSAWQMVRQERPFSSICALVWHSHIPKKMSFLVWRLFHKWLPVEQIQQMRGTSLASKCVCCHNIETIPHVFFTNKIAANIWDHFALLFGLPQVLFNNVNQVILHWSLNSNTVGHIRQVMPVIILWVLWEFRNKTKHGELTYEFQNIQKRIEHLIIYLGKTELLQYKHWKGDFNVAVAFGIKVYKPVQKRPYILSWHRPTQGNLKLNIDGSYKLGDAGLGGILRNCQGEFIGAVNFFCKATSPLHSEMLAALKVLQWCFDQGYQNLEVESDSLSLVQMIASQNYHWSTYNLMKEVTNLLLSTKSKITHIKREQNKAADMLAREAMNLKGSLIFLPHQIGKKIKGLIELERRGIPYIRG
ncbi:hypothetical protein LIER_37404 [Lithospermum erythrorhizon]|uniref:RNase H type-1 domain-containing protein n=1 Tax=Lithospermum erythrorhizon TaxID=34254 RepID=A0AAV3PNZ1_LITER